MRRGFSDGLISKYGLVIVNLVSWVALIRCKIDRRAYLRSKRRRA